MRTERRGKERARHTSIINGGSGTELNQTESRIMQDEKIKISFITLRFYLDSAPVIEG